MSDNRPTPAVGSRPPMDTGADMKAQETTPLTTKSRHSSPEARWRAIWALEDGQPRWLLDSVTAMDAAIQGELGHS